jgi:predicted nucleic-acid-binding protein
VKIAADTNVLVRALTEDHPAQSQAAQRELREAQQVVLPVASLCELVWVLARAYGIDHAGIARAINGLLAAENVVTDRPTVAAGLAILEAGGDFADGVIAYEGRWAGAETLVTFDRHAARLLGALGHAARAPGASARHDPPRP